MSIDTITVAWFSAGVSSAVATKLMVDEVDHIIYQHIDDHHPDTMRFVRDCEEWFGKSITIRQSPYRTVEACCRARNFINHPRQMASCTRILKRRDRAEWEADNRWFCLLRYIWGMDVGEAHRADGIRHMMREDDHVFPLIDRGLSKADAHGILREAGITRPAMYNLGYPNNNCIGCVKGGMGYWNRIRVDFPDVFAARAKMERDIGASCINGVYLDELDPEAGRELGPIVQECGAMCQATAIDGVQP